VREFAARVSRIETPLEPWRIVQIQPLGDKTPIIAIENTMSYYNLARRIGTDRPFLGVQLVDPSIPRSLPPGDMMRSRPIMCALSARRSRTVPISYLDFV